MLRVFVSDGMSMLEGLEDAVRERASGAVAFEWAVVESADGLVDAAADADGLVDAAADADVLVVGPEAPVTRRVLEVLDVAAVVRAGIGVDNVDVEAARELEWW